MRMAVRELTSARITSRHSGGHFSSFVPHSRNYGGQAGRDLLNRNPGLKKPWAILLCHFMARGHRSRLAPAATLAAGQMIPVAAGLSLTSNCRRSLHKVRPWPLDLAQGRVLCFRSDFGGLLHLNQVLQIVSRRVSGIPYRSPAVFDILSIEVIHYS
jgi:hypothetical protein